MKNHVNQALTNLPGVGVREEIHEKVNSPQAEALIIAR
jgi:hypothetical protein